MKPIKIIPISRWLYRVEVQMPGGYWRCVHDCPGIPWVAAKKYLPTTEREQPNDPTPSFYRGVGQSVFGVVVTREDIFGKNHQTCDWCFQNPRDYLAVSDKGREFVCSVCAADVDGPFVE